MKSSFKILYGINYIVHLSKHQNQSTMIKVTPQEVSEIVGCSGAMVARVLNGTRSADTPLGREILRIHKLLEANARRQNRELEKLHESLKRSVPKIKKMR